MKVGIATVTTGFNYGTSLQAYASKLNLEKMGYDAEILGYRGSIVKGRDVRINKLVNMVLNTLFNPKLMLKTYKIYRTKLKKEISFESKLLFQQFSESKLEVNRMTYRQMKRYGASNEVLGLLCGSDQIWSLSSVYVDPFYYLDFAPKYKRISYAPSFGSSEIKEYNKKTISKYLNGFNNISVREKEGQDVVKKLINRSSEVHIDPTLLINNQEWKLEMTELKLEQEYALVYFLDSPTDSTLEEIIKRVEDLKIRKIISLPYIDEKIKNKLNNIEIYQAGPLEFLSLIYNSKIVLTDSYHGMLFSINFNKEFYIYERNYGTSSNQSSRIESILNILKLSDRFIKNKQSKNKNDKINWIEVNEILEFERKKSIDYLRKCLEMCGERNE